jgi:hypothetical protein
MNNDLKTEHSKTMTRQYCMEDNLGEQYVRNIYRADMSTEAQVNKNTS